MEPGREGEHRLRYVANCSMLFTEYPLLQRPAAAAGAGFDAVEFWWPFPHSVPADDEVDRFVSAVTEARVELVGLNLAAGDMSAGDRGLVSWRGREREFFDSVQVAAGIGARLGTRVFNALYGLRTPGIDPADQDELAVANLALAAQAVAGLGALVLLEPVSGSPRYPLRTAADVVAVIDRVARDCGVDNIRLLADLYHLSVNGDDPADVVRRHRAHIGHVQIADSPGRHEPGTGSLDLAGPLRELAAGGYPGWVGLEYAPATTTAEGLSWLPRRLRADPDRQGVR